MAFKKGDIAARGIRIMGSVCVTFNNKIVKVVGGKAFLEDSSLQYDAETGREIDPAIPGCTSFLVSYEEAVTNIKSRRWSLDGGEELPDMGKIKQEAEKPKKAKKSKK
jgi:hypothetical protein